MTKLTSFVRAGSDRILLTPALRGIAWLLRPLWAVLAFLGKRVWLWLLRPVWRALVWVLRPVWRWVLRPVWLVVRWIGLQLWRWVLQPVWRWVLQPVWRWVLRPVWLMLRLAALTLLASPWILARTLPNRGWLAGGLVLALTGAVLFVPGVLNANTPQPLVPLAASTALRHLGSGRPEVTVDLRDFIGWGVEPQIDDHEIVLRRGEAVLRLRRQDDGQDAQVYLDWYLHTQLGVRGRRDHNPERVTVPSGQNGSVRASRMTEDYVVKDPHNDDLDRYHEVSLTSYSTTLVLVVLSTGGREPTPLGEQFRALVKSMRITP